MNQEAARRRVLARHHLLDRTADVGVTQVADDLVGLHATSPTTPYLSAHARIRGFACGDLDEALYARRELVRLKGMRGTVFLVSRRLAPLVFAATRAATVASDRRWLKTNEQVYARLTPRVLDALAGRSLAANDLRRSLGVDPDLAGVVAMLCDEGIVVRDRPLGGRASSQFRYRLWSDALPDVALDAWDDGAATRELVRRYTDGFGPVSRADLIWWTGLPARQIDAAVRGLGEELVPVSIAGLGEDLLATPAALAETGGIDDDATSVSLLPMLDPYTMGYRDRARLLEPRLTEVVVDRGGNVTSVVLVGGRVAGVWDLVARPRPAVRVLLFDAGQRQRVLERAAETGAFWFDGSVPVEEYDSMTPLRQRSGVMRRPLDGATPQPVAPQRDRRGSSSDVGRETATTTDSRTKLAGDHPAAPEVHR